MLPRTLPNKESQWNIWLSLKIMHGVKLFAQLSREGHRSESPCFRRMVFYCCYTLCAVAHKYWNSIFAWDKMDFPMWKTNVIITNQYRNSGCRRTNLASIAINRILVISCHNVWKEHQNLMRYIKRTWARRLVLISSILYLFCQKALKKK